MAINPANEEQEEELANIDTITVSDEEMELQDDNDVNDLLNMFADMEGMEA